MNTILPSWADTPARQRVIDFVTMVTVEGSSSFIPIGERIAAFDNDGTLWSEQPYYFQLAFALDRVRALAVDHPEWSTTQPYQAVLENDLQALAAGGMKGLVELIGATHAGMTTDEFAAIVTDWIASARHPTTGRPYTRMVFQPMLELLDYLRDHGFKTYIVSGGGVEFMRAFAEDSYGIPPEQVIGSSGVTQFEMRDTGPVLIKLPQIDFIDDNVGKPIGINSVIGRRPVIAFGNSDGDLQMLQWTAAGSGPRLMGLIHHTDAEREWAYDQDSYLGRLDRALTEARASGWLIVDMKQDWLTVYPE
jgi:phosphoglycolate phosphatase-like HAD superfamily hydrolase